ncbi:hypothetical protein CDS [Bradyrhizobium sp.]|nr:hypothetical protein CDS [Bradyrhizobium sp.]
MSVHEIIWYATAAALVCTAAAYGIGWGYVLIRLYIAYR